MKRTDNLVDEIAKILAEESAEDSIEPQGKATPKAGSEDPETVEVDPQATDASKQREDGAEAQDETDPLDVIEEEDDDEKKVDEEDDDDEELDEEEEVDEEDEDEMKSESDTTPDEKENKASINSTVEPKAKRGEELEDPAAIKEHVSAILSGKKVLSEKEFAKKTHTIFEAALKKEVRAKSIKIRKQVRESYKKKLKKEIASLTEALDRYLDVCMEKWSEENRIALERGLSIEIAESLLEDVRRVFTRHNVNLPTEKIDLVEKTMREKEKLEKKLDERAEEIVTLRRQLKQHKKEKLIQETLKDLPDSTRDRLQPILEEISFTNEKEFSKKAKQIKESYRQSKGSKKTLAESQLSEGYVMSGNGNANSVDPEIAEVLKYMRVKK